MSELRYWGPIHLPKLFWILEVSDWLFSCINQSESFKIAQKKSLPRYLQSTYLLRCLEILWVISKHVNYLGWNLILRTKGSGFWLYFFPICYLLIYITEQIISEKNFLQLDDWVHSVSRVIHFLIRMCQPKAHFTSANADIYWICIKWCQMFNSFLQNKFHSYYLEI